MDWAGLPPKLLEAILGKLIESTDHLRFRCVCRSWRRSGKSHPVPTSSIPWLHLPQDLTSTVLKFYSLSENRIYEIPFPEVYYSHVIGSASGFFLVVGYRWNAKVLIINPFTGTRAHLPYNHRLSTDPVWDYSGSVIVAGLGKGFGDFGGVAYCRPGYFHLLEYEASEVCIVDGETLQKIRIIRPPNFDSQFSLFVVSPDDIMLSNDYRFNNDYTWWISVFFTPNSLLEKPSWSKFTDIGNYALFCGGKLYILSEASRESGLRNTLVKYKPRVRNMPTPSCYIYAHSFE
ncbi:hypothetical protein LUZ63_012425 [Rhynchospora breviuscula]|uniref:F-box domain-containing protein n=1 Tax=Rhynchospora breviuscula TaxID=2022672 RepID=A0A9Q0HRI0_9POAL|nr:hypothetical protein LUZ63_012425 [Rhynchospora breviuscula]